MRYDLNYDRHDFLSLSRSLLVYLSVFLSVHVCLNLFFLCPFSLSLHLPISMSLSIYQCICLSLYPVLVLPAFLFFFCLFFYVPAYSASNSRLSFPPILYFHSFATGQGEMEGKEKGRRKGGRLGHVAVKAGGGGGAGG